MNGLSGIKLERVGLPPLLIHFESLDGVNPDAEHDPTLVKLKEGLLLKGGLNIFYFPLTYWLTNNVCE